MQPLTCEVETCDRPRFGAGRWCSGHHICGICGSDSDLVIDHDHDTKRVRGLLCRGCNAAIGHLHDDMGLILKAAEWVALKPVDANVPSDA